MEEPRARPARQGARAGARLAWPVVSRARAGVTGAQGRASVPPAARLHCGRRFARGEIGAVTWRAPAAPAAVGAEDGRPRLLAEGAERLRERRAAAAARAARWCGSGGGLDDAAGAAREAGITAGPRSSRSMRMRTRSRRSSAAASASSSHSSAARRSAAPTTCPAARSVSQRARCSSLNSRATRAGGAADRTSTAERGAASPGAREGGVVRPQREGHLAEQRPHRKTERWLAAELLLDRALPCRRHLSPLLLDEEPHRRRSHAPPPSRRPGARSRPDPPMEHEARRLPAARGARPRALGPRRWERRCPPGERRATAEVADAAPATAPAAPRGPARGGRAFASSRVRRLPPLEPGEVDGWVPSATTASSRRASLRGACSPRPRGARRASRVNRLAPPLSPARDRLLDVLGCDGAPALARLLARPRPAPPPWTPRTLRAALDRHAPGEVERAIARAEAAAAGRLAVFGEEVCVARPGGGTDWQLDPLHGGRFAAWAPSSRAPARAGPRPQDGVVGGARRAVGGARAGRGARRAPRRRARRGALRLGPRLRGREPGRPRRALDQRDGGGAPRLEPRRSPCGSSRRAARRPTPTSRSRRPGSSSPRGRFVLAHLEDDTAVPNNHLAADWLGLLACAEALPEWPEAPRWRALALAGLGAALRRPGARRRHELRGVAPLPAPRRGALLGRARSSRAPRGARSAATTRGGSPRLFRSTRALLSSSGEHPADRRQRLGPRARAARARADRGRLPPAARRRPLPRRRRSSSRPGAAGRRRGGVAPRAAGARRARARCGRAARRRAPRSRRAGSTRSAAARFEVVVSCGANGQRGIGGHSHNDKLVARAVRGRRARRVRPGQPELHRRPRAPERVPRHARARHRGGGRARAGAHPAGAALRAPRRVAGPPRRVRARAAPRRRSSASTAASPAPGWSTGARSR